MTPGLITRGTAAPASSTARPGAGVRLRPRTPDIRFPRLPVILAVAILLGLASALWADIPLAHLAARASPLLLRIAGVFSAFGNSSYMLAISGLLAVAAYAARGRAGSLSGDAVKLLGERALFVFATVAVSGLLAQAVKHLVGRARPRLFDAMGAFHFDLFSLKASLASFPSGHTASAFGLAVALGLMERRLAPVLLALALLVAVARVALDAHYASDVVAGATLGTVVTLALARLFAGRGLAFAHDGTGIRLKGDGSVWPGLASLARGRAA